MELLQYNTKRKYLGLREYGRHIQKMVDYLLSIEDRQKRNEQAKCVIELMGLLNPHLQSVEDYRHMLWDHLFAISDFTLDVDSPYPIPQKETYKIKGDPMKYPNHHPKYSHLGKNIELVIEKALKEPNEEKKSAFATSIAYYMKLTYSNWHKEMIHDDTIRGELNIITNGQLEFSSTPNIKRNKNSFFENDEINYNQIVKKQNPGNRSNGGNGKGGNQNNSSKAEGKFSSRDGGNRDRTLSNRNDSRNSPLNSSIRDNNSSRSLRRKF